jgi:Phage tail lysozyme
MSILETFYFLFKSNADDLKKGTKEAGKAADELDEKIKKNKDTTKELGEGFTSIIESGAKALAAYVALGSIKSGILNAAEYNTQLQIQSKLLGQNVADLQVFAAANEAFGGSKEGFLGFMENAQQQAVQLGRPLPNLIAMMDSLRDRVRGLDKESAMRIINGVGAAGLTPMILAEDDAYKKLIETVRLHNKVSADDGVAAQSLTQDLNLLGGSLSSVFTTMGTDAAPAIKVLTKSFEGLNGFMTEQKGIFYGIFSALGLGIAAAVSAIAAPAGIATIALAGLASAIGLFTVGGGIRAIVEHKNEPAPPSVDGIPPKPIRSEIPIAKENPTSFPHLNNQNPKIKQQESFERAQHGMKMLVDDGYTREQAAGMMARFNFESGGLNTKAVGDGGRAIGIAQWHPDRREKIEQGTGIDIKNTDFAGQMKAVIWELRNTETEARKRILSTNSPKDAEFATTKFYERPASNFAQIGTRERYANQFYEAGQSIQAANASPFNTASNVAPTVAGGDKTVSVKIDAVNVHTQATDSNAMAVSVSQELQKQIKTTIALMDDGRLL